LKETVILKNINDKLPYRIRIRVKSSHIFKINFIYKQMPRKGILKYEDLVFGNQEIEKKTLNDDVFLIFVDKNKN